MRVLTTMMLPTLVGFLSNVLQWPAVLGIGGRPPAGYPVRPRPPTAPGGLPPALPPAFPVAPPAPRPLAAPMPNAWAAGGHPPPPATHAAAMFPAFAPLGHVYGGTTANLGGGCAGILPSIPDSKQITILSPIGSSMKL